MSVEKVLAEALESLAGPIDRPDPGDYLPDLPTPAEFAAAILVTEPGSRLTELVDAVVAFDDGVYDGGGDRWWAAIDRIRRARLSVVGDPS